jgi:hypothetical protein
MPNYTADEDNPVIESVALESDGAVRAPDEAQPEQTVGRRVWQQKQGVRAYGGSFDHLTKGP